MRNRKVLQVTNVCNSVKFLETVFQWRQHFSAEVLFIGEELENNNHAEERDQTDAVGQKHQWVSSQNGCEGYRGWGTRKEQQNKFKEGETEVKSLWKIPPGLSVSISASPLPAVCICFIKGFSCTSGNMMLVWKF